MNKKIYIYSIIICILTTIFTYSSCSKIRNIDSTDSTCNGNDCHVSSILAKTVRSHGKHDVHTKRFKCENCHYKYFTHSNHQNRIDDIISNSDVVSFDELNPNTVWDNSTKDCSLIDCHGGAAGLINWYAAGSGCTSCHSTAQGSRRIVLGAGGDFTRTSHHVTGGIQDSDCRVCHDQSNHMSGTVRLLDVDTGAGSNFDPATLNNLCLSCHDSNGANGNTTPFSDLKTVPDVKGAAGSLWTDSAHNTKGYADNGGIRLHVTETG